MSRRTLDTGTKDLLAHVDDGVAVITMNRPERRNAMSGGMLTAMSAALAVCETDPEVVAEIERRHGPLALRVATELRAVQVEPWTLIHTARLEKGL